MTRENLESIYTFTHQVGTVWYHESRNPAGLVESQRFFSMQDARLTGEPGPDVNVVFRTTETIRLNDSWVEAWGLSFELDGKLFKAYDYDRQYVRAGDREVSLSIQSVRTKGIWEHFVKDD